MQRDDAERLADLLPMRYGRMAQSAFAFYRGAAAIMASDLQSTPISGLRTQIAGDAHLANFGAYASPERRWIFDVDDFDETTHGPWEWDLKRLCASIAIVGRHRAFRRRTAAEAVRTCVESYRTHLARFAEMPALDLWYARIDEATLRVAAPRAFDADSHVPRIVADGNGSLRIAERPPTIFHPDDAAGFVASTRDAVARYGRTLSTDRRTLLGRFRFCDAAYKVVGVGSVGTRCAAALVACGSEPLFLQLKEARASAYAPYVGAHAFKNEGDRVVAGQRLMQAASDLFLGWTRARDGRTYYVRQLRDMKAGVDLDAVTPGELARYAALCGSALARAHAKASSDPAAIAGYLGGGGGFDAALVAFAHAYADQNDADYAALRAAIASGRITAAI